MTISAGEWKLPLKNSEPKINFGLQYHRFMEEFAFFPNLDCGR